MSIRPAARTTRVVAVGTIVVVLAFGYAFLARYFGVSEMPVERHFGAEGAGGPFPQTYIELISIDALNGAMQTRVSLAPSRALYGERLAPAEQSLRLVITHDNAVEEIKVAANDRPPTATFEVDLNDGSVADYPLIPSVRSCAYNCSRKQRLPPMRQSCWLPR